MPDCVPFPTWAVDDENGKLEFLDAPGGTFTIPNQMIRWEGEADSELDQAVYDGDNHLAYDGDVPLPVIEGERLPSLHCEMTFWSDPDGTLYDNATEGMYANLAILAAIANLTTTATAGLQTLRWTPYNGATPSEFEAHVLPIVFKDPAPGRGMSLTIPLVIQDPEDI